MPPFKVVKRKKNTRTRRDRTNNNTRSGGTLKNALLVWYDRIGFGQKLPPPPLPAPLSGIIDNDKTLSAREAATHGRRPFIMPDIAAKSCPQQAGCQQQQQLQARGINYYKV